MHCLRLLKLTWTAINTTVVQRSSCIHESTVPPAVHFQSLHWFLGTTGIQFYKDYSTWKVKECWPKHITPWIAHCYEKRWAWWKLIIGTAHILNRDLMGDWQWFDILTTERLLDRSGDESISRAHYKWKKPTGAAAHLPSHTPHRSSGQLEKSQFQSMR